ncbi:N-acetyltransferase DgcN [Roseibium marinum]|uniref:Putative NAD-dependent epimerase/dehydratase family protein n=1 Tax=Roseibium marinum TaxID=281252 RepID=A0A2S3UKC6_9HYPH|nr:N-acetyltransferase DgcN [Roseibium marinum]POF28157.1 putative NAD-dependent epimerase/dehydratase family protein [Roseibium marinum]
MEIARPYLLFLGDVADSLAAKTAIGIVDWRKDWCIGQIRLQGCAADTGLPDMSIADGAAAGAKTFVIGAVNAGGRLPEHWIDSIVAALEAGMDVASGLHVRLGDIPAIRSAAEKNGRQLHDVRHSTTSFATGKGTRRSGKRILAVGTDCSVGKKYTALAMDKAMNERGYTSSFCATGQTGVFISGRGASLDAVIADFISGAAEWLSPETDDSHWQIIEGQGSLFHPSFAGVTLGLLHGSQPDGFIVCHEPTRTRMRGVETPLPTIQQVIDLTVQCGRLTNPDIRCVGIAVNTAALGDDEALAYLAKVGEQYGLPATDPVRYGMEAIVDKVSAEFGAP